MPDEELGKRGLSQIENLQNLLAIDVELIQLKWKYEDLVYSMAKGNALPEDLVNGMNLQIVEFTKLYAAMLPQELRRFSDMYPNPSLQRLGRRNPNEPLSEDEVWQATSDYPHLVSYLLERRPLDGTQRRIVVGLRNIYENKSTQEVVGSQLLEDILDKLEQLRQ
jgi:hypothetical protein